MNPHSSPRITPQQAAQELLRRRRARESLAAFSQAITIPGAPVSDDPAEWLFKPIETSVAKHHMLMLEEIQRCIEADGGRLMIFAPPGSAKSSYASVVTPPWAMARVRHMPSIVTRVWIRSSRSRSDTGETAKPFWASATTKPSAARRMAS